MYIGTSELRVVVVLLSSPGSGTTFQKAQDLV